MRVTLKSGVSPKWLTFIIVGGKFIVRIFWYEENCLLGGFGMRKPHNLNERDTKKWSESGRWSGLPP